MTDDRDHPPLHVGDHVGDREDPDGATMLVVSLPGTPADDFVVGDARKTVAEFNPEYPAGDTVVGVTYPQRTDVTVGSGRTYSFPRSRLQLVAPIHDIDVELESDGDADPESATADPR